MQDISLVTVRRCDCDMSILADDQDVALLS